MHSGILYTNGYHLTMMRCLKIKKKSVITSINIGQQIGGLTLFVLDTYASHNSVRTTVHCRIICMFHHEFVRFTRLTKTALKEELQN